MSHLKRGITVSVSKPKNPKMFVIRRCEVRLRNLKISKKQKMEKLIISKKQQRMEKLKRCRVDLNNSDYKNYIQQYQAKQVSTRRSRRKSRSDLMKEENERLVKNLTVKDDSSHGIEIAAIENKGRGIKVRTSISSFLVIINFSFPLQAVKGFSKGDFVVEYSGELIDIGTAKDLETKYSLDASKGCYMYYFKHKGKQYW